MMEHAEHSPAAIREKAAGAVNCQSVTLPSGLTVLCRTMPGYSSVHAMYATNFGSVVREFTLNGKRIQLPAGPVAQLQAVALIAGGDDLSVVADHVGDLTQ